MLGNEIITYGEWRGSGIELEGSNRNILRGNDLSGTPLGVFVRSGVANELRRNSAIGAHADNFDGPRDGFLVSAAAQRTVLHGNTATGFDQNGFSIYGGRAAMGNNAAIDNGVFGIDALATVIDLGGNRASGNGGPEQCRNVQCR